MGWRVHVLPRAREQISALDPSMREELIERVAEMAASPAEFLARADAPTEFAGLYVFSYKSEIAAGIVFRLYFVEFDIHARQLVLLALLSADISPEAP